MAPPEDALEKDSVALFFGFLGLVPVLAMAWGVAQGVAARAGRLGARRGEGRGVPRHASPQVKPFGL